ncbi:hypothetical protein EGW08_018387 [Elysia chlorotica]|uniref:G-protein coupled receptors family 1 profile domain-containing protein n=1 Tax=Elysia chlorotica TaxID=188477 RepID=A0A3S0Z9J8_ELYCH|nr:hypothetical protein EGW08_018387 [Elysia chlorotica]
MRCFKVGDTTPEFGLLFSNSSVFKNLSSNRALSMDENLDSEFSSVMEFISYAMICVALCGILGNILVIITYAKIGLSESINISYCALGVSDLLVVLSIAWGAVCYVPAFIESDVPFLPRQVVIITGDACIEMFGSCTAWLTAFISLERCLCVLLPLKFKDIITWRRSILIILTIFTLTIASFLGVYLNLYSFETTFAIERNETVLGFEFQNSTDADLLYDFSLAFSAVVMNLLPVTFIFVCSTTLVVNMRRKATWRLSATSQATGQNGAGGSDNRARRNYMADMRVSKTVLAICAASCVLGSLFALRSLLAVTVSGFLPTEVYGPEYRMSSRLLFLLSGVNSSFNVAIYYKTGSTFRATTRRLFRLKDTENARQ